MKKIIVFLILLTAVFGAVTPFYLEMSDTLGQSQYYSTSLQLKQFASYEELKSFIESNQQIGPYYWGWEETWGLRPSGGVFDSTGGLASNREKLVVPDYSKTNVQFEGVDEADIVKTDGEFIYVISGKNITILKAYPAEEAEIFSQIQLNGILKGTFINGDKLILFEEKDSKVFIKMYDVSDRRNPILTRNGNVSLDGWYFNSRMIGQHVYVVVNKPANLQDNEVALPKTYTYSKVEETPAFDIYYTDIPDYSYMFTTIAAINIQNPEEISQKTLLLGTANLIYVSLNNIFITFREIERTLLYRIHIDRDEIDIAANGEVPGYVLDQFSMDVHEGYFRIATTTGGVARSFTDATSRNHVYVLDMNLDIVGRLEGLAPGENIHSARFMGDRCYLVTFRKIDPLFVIDLRYPDSPTVLGELKITGYSDYLHPYDENHIIGIGKETIAAEEGDFAWYQGLKISLFDVSNVEEPREIAKYEIGDRGTESPILNDHKALLFDKARNLLVIPVRVAEIDETQYPEGVPPYAYGEFVWQGAYVFDITLGEGILLKGRITHLEEVDATKYGYYSSPYFVERSLYIDNVLYTISNKKIKMNNLDGLYEINEVELP